MEKEKNELVETTVYGLASYLMTKGYALKEVAFKNDFTPKIKTFIFVGDKKIKEEMSNYWNNYPVPVRDFVNATKHLKKRLYW